MTSHLKKMKAIRDPKIYVISTKKKITLVKTLRLKLQIFFQLTHFQFKQVIVMTSYTFVTKTDLNKDPLLQVIWQISWGLGSAGRLEWLWLSVARWLAQAFVHGYPRIPSNKTEQTLTCLHLATSLWKENKQWEKKKSPGQKF